MPVKRCPMCHLVNQTSAERCDCGYEFGKSADQALALLRDQRTTAWITLGFLIVSDVGAVVFLALLTRGLFFPMIGLIVCLVMTAKVARKLVITRASMRQLAPRALPRATLHKG
jgi:hypothetical protein